MGDTKLTTYDNSKHPIQDSTANDQYRDVIGNKTDTTAGNSVISLQRKEATSNRHIPKFGGYLWFVNVAASDGDGKTPDTAFTTIGAAISAASAGDAINVMAGTYDEDGLDLNKSALELWCEIGVVITNTAPGTVLTVSANNIKINNGFDSCKITPATDQIGINITGENCQAHDVRVKGVADAGNSWNLAGGGAILRECRAFGIKSGNKAFNIISDGNKLYNCGTIGSTTSYGYYLSGSIKNGLLVNCTSAGHQTSGFYLATGVSAYTLLNCSSGAGDGKWHDIDNVNVWSNFFFDNNLYKTWTAAGATSTNLFKITGIVQIEKIYGHVEDTALSADIDTLKLDLSSAAGVNDITAAVDPDSAPVGSLLIKDDDAAEGLAVYSSATNNVIEQSTSNQSGQQPIVAFDLQQETGEDTHIRATQTGVGTSGKIHWHVIWKPVTDDGFVQVV